MCLEGEAEARPEKLSHRKKVQPTLEFGHAYEVTIVAVAGMDYKCGPKCTET